MSNGKYVHEHRQAVEDGQNPETRFQRLVLRQDEVFDAAKVKAGGDWRRLPENSVGLALDAFSVYEPEVDEEGDEAG